jgi:hypothetical protein
VIKSISRCPVSSILRVSAFPEFCCDSDPLPGVLQELIDVAGGSQSVLVERNIIVAPYKEQQQEIKCENPEGHASGSGTYQDNTPHGLDVL